MGIFKDKLYTTVNTYKINNNRDNIWIKHLCDYVNWVDKYDKAPNHATETQLYAWMQNNLNQYKCNKLNKSRVHAIETVFPGLLHRGGDVSGYIKERLTPTGEVSYETAQVLRELQLDSIDDLIDLLRRLYNHRYYTRSECRWGYPDKIEAGSRFGPQFIEDSGVMTMPTNVSYQIDRIMNTLNLYDHIDHTNLFKICKSD